MEAYHLFKDHSDIYEKKKKSLEFLPLVVAEKCLSDSSAKQIFDPMNQLDKLDIVWLWYDNNRQVFESISESFLFLFRRRISAHISYQFISDT